MPWKSQQLRQYTVYKRNSWHFAYIWRLEVKSYTKIVHTFIHFSISGVIGFLLMPKKIHMVNDSALNRRYRISLQQGHSKLFNWNFLTRKSHIRVTTQLLKRCGSQHQLWYESLYSMHSASTARMWTCSDI